MRGLLIAVLAAATTSCFVSESGQVANNCLQNGILVDPCVVNARAGQTVELAGSIAGNPGAPVDWILPQSAADAFDVVAEPNKLTLVSKQNVTAVFPVQASDPADSARFSGASIQVSRADFANTPPPFVLFGGDLPVGSKSSATAAGGNLYYVAYADSNPPGSVVGAPLNFYVQQYETSTNRLLATVVGQFLDFNDPQAALPIVPNVAADCAGNGYWIDVDPALGYVLRKLAPGATTYEQVALGGYTQLRLDTLSVACDGALYFIGQTADYSGADGAIYSIALLPDRRGVLGGVFKSYDGLPRSGVVRVLPDGRLDPSFQPGQGASGPVFAVLPQPNGKLLVGGSFSFFDGIFRPGLVRLNGDGSFDSAFNPLLIPPQVAQSVVGSLITVNALAAQPDGKVCVGGNFSTSGGLPGNSIVRLGTSGNLDPSFDAGAGATLQGFAAEIYAVAVQPDGKIIVGGYFDQFGGEPRNNVARLNADGSVDAGFQASNLGPDDRVQTLELQPDGKCLIGGRFLQVDGQPRRGMARLNADGTLDTSFDPGAGLGYLAELPGMAYDLALQEDGSVLVAGFFDQCGTTPRNNIVRVDSTGHVDTKFNPGTGANSAVHAVLLEPDDKIVIGGEFTSYNGFLRDQIARLNLDGSIDNGAVLPTAAQAASRGPVRPAGQAFGPSAGPDGVVGDVIVQPDQSILIAGDFTALTDLGIFAPRPGIARILADGTIDFGFDPSSGVPAGSSFGALALQPDGRILLAGIVAGGQGLPGVLRLNADGSRDNGFSSVAFAGSTLPGISEIAALAVQADGKILVGGRFDSFAGQPFNGLVRLNADGSVDSTFNAGAGGLDAQGLLGNVFDLVVQADGTILVGGFFRSFGGFPRGSLVRLSADGLVDSTFNTGSQGFDFNVYTVVPDPAVPGTILVGGDFTSYAGQTRRAVARLDASTGTLDASFDPGLGPQSSGQQLPFVYSLVPDPFSGSILACGSFDSFGGVTRGNIARLDFLGNVDTAFAPVSGADGPVFAADLASSGLIAIGGAFLAYDGTPRSRFSLLNPDGTPYTTDPGPGSSAPLGLNRIEAFGQYPRFVLPVDLATVAVLDSVDSMVVDSKGRLLVGSSNVEALAWGARLLVDPRGASSVVGIDTEFIDVLGGEVSDPDLITGPVADVAVDAGDVAYFAIDGGFIDGQHVSARNTMGEEVYRVSDYLNLCPTGCSDPLAACGETVPFEKIVSIGAAGPGYLRIVDDISTGTLPVECQESLRFIMLDPR